MTDYRITTTNKYRNRFMRVDGMLFRSQKEAKRYVDLKLLQKAGKIEKLECQRSYELAPPVLILGKRHRALRYVADFVYRDLSHGGVIVEDSKGVRTPTYRIKKHLMKHVYGIDVLET